MTNEERARALLDPFIMGRMNDVAEHEECIRRTAEELDKAERRGHYELWRRISGAPGNENGGE